MILKINSTQELIMRAKNKQITLTSGAALQILTDIEFILISLKNIARHYYDNVDNAEDIDPMAYALETTRFIDKNDVVYKLAEMRKLVSESYDNQLDPDELEALEEMIDTMNVWLKPGD
jgi:hypothetical protein